MGAEATIGMWAGFVLTLMILSYLLSDNVLYRLAVYAFVGVTGGYVTAVTLERVVAPFVRATLLSGDPGAIAFGTVPLIFAVLLLFGASNRFYHLGSIPLAFLIGVGAAVALVGAISGTLLPIAGGAAEGTAADPVNGFLVVLGIVCTLLAFGYLARRTPGASMRAPTPGQPPLGFDTRTGLITRVFGAVGQGVIAITLGAVYAGAILTGLTVLTERIAALVFAAGG
jgi:hypothetical protein